MDSKTVIKSTEAIAAGFAENTIERQRRRKLDPKDFERLREAGFLLTGVPSDQGGLWQGAAKSVREYSRMVRVIAHGDPSVALVAAMHPAVAVFFLGIEEVSDAQDEWQVQRQWVIDAARHHWWGTITSEPGSGGDILQTRSKAVQKQGNEYSLSGNKHFGSGSGHARYMITTARCEGQDKPDLFYLETKGVPWDGSTGCEMTIEWDGIGMNATQSHAFRFSDFPATKVVSAEILPRVNPLTSVVSNMLFTGVVLGVADNALQFAKNKLAAKQDSMRPFEAMEWARCQNELWLAEQAYEGAITAVEEDDPQAQLSVLRCKITTAELVESALSRMSKVVGGASFSKAMPLAQWTQDVKALGFLRPPLPLAYDQLKDLSVNNS